MPAGSILVADDDAAIRTVLNQALSRAGYEVRSTGNAATLWRWVSALNLRHPNWAWFSLFSVLSVDVYIRMLNAGWFTDPHIGF